ncbi:hypothetical protein CHUAL_003313 [Chamberlinius hualienensis]
MYCRQNNVQIPNPLSARYHGTFAYVTVKDRLPVILTKVVDGLVRNKTALMEKYGQESKEELKTVINRLSKLKNEMTTDKPLTDISDGRDDASLWNRHLNEVAEEQKKDGKSEKVSWYTSAWLLTETYMYRRIQEAFELSVHMALCDPFEEQKQMSFRNSMAAIQILANYLIETKNLIVKDEELKKNSFSKFLQIALWGNKCDMSISCGVDSSQSLNPLTQLKNLRSHILVNNIELIWNHLKKQRSINDTVRIDIILDNAGFELFTDLCLADFLTSQGLANHVHFHLKAMPWYISDVTTNDFIWTLSESKQDPKLKQLGDNWDKYIEEGQWTFSAHDFWTSGYDYSHLKETAPDLHNELQKSQLLIFKGDLNYRKLTGDLHWPYDASFSDSLRGFNPTALCSLRTIKADTVVGLNPGQAEVIEKMNKDWMISGDYAVIQFN